MDAMSPGWFGFGRSMLVAAAVRAEQLRATSMTPKADESDPDSSTLVGNDPHDSVGGSSDSINDIDASRRALDEHLAGDGAFPTIAGNAGLTTAEAEVLAVLAAAESDLHCRSLVAAIQGDSASSRLTLGTIVNVFGGRYDAVLTLGHESALRRAALVDVIANGPWADHVVAVSATVVWALVGDTSPDADLPDGLDSFTCPPEDQLDDPVDEAAPLVVVNGPDSMRRRQAGARQAVGGRFLCARVDDSTSPDAWSALVREATITGQGVIVEVDASLPAIGRRWIERARHISWVVSAKNGPPVAQMPSRPWLGVEASDAEPTDAEWTEAFGAGVERTHHLTFDQLHRVARARKASGGDLDAAVRRLASGPLEQLTRRIAPTRTWDDIVLSPDRLDALRSIVDRYQHSAKVYDEWGFAATPSRGVVALFSGPSGTGKTLASEIISGELGLDLFKLDLSSVVSKYIGETEKNLEQIFDAASAANMVLFFDEADSLFGKRSEVKDARDRYANIEVSYLLQRLETYNGMVVMATNFEKNVDEAFLRRIHTRVAFALPGPEERVRIWHHNLPENAPTDGIDVEWLANQFELSGGTIRNACVQAAFAAAALGESVTMRAAVLGVASELRKMGRLLRPEDFGEHYSSLEL